MTNECAVENVASRLHRALSTANPDDGIRVRSNGSAYLTDKEMLNLYQKLLTEQRAMGGT